MLHFIDYIYFFYGLAFFLFGFSILHYPMENSIFKFTRELKYLGVFGILHGISEWLVMFKSLGGNETEELFYTAGWITMGLSYSVLFYFSLRVIWNKKYSMITLALIILVLPALLAGFHSLTLNNINIFVRYFLGLPGIFMTAYIFYHPVYLVQGSVYASMKRCAYVLASTFFLYGIFAGLIVPTGTFFPSSVINAESFEAFTSLPVELFRALCAMLASYAITQILREFKRQTDFHLLRLSKALEESGDTVVITDLQGKIEYVNRAFEQQSGYLAEEVIGQTPNILRSGEHHGSFYQHLWDTILSGETYQGVLTNKRKDETLYNEFKTIVPLKNKRQELTSFISTGKDITSRIIFEHELEKAAATDPLTNAANRLQCNRWLKLATEHAQDTNISVALILFDIDDFKKVNDTFGHNTGDDVLIRIAEIVRTMVRSNDIFARWGGEEFVILQIDTPYEGTIALAERLRKEIEESVFENVGTLTISIGVSQYDGSESIESFVKKADDAMYQAKREGKNKVVVNKEDGNH
ncbi:sensor domain-containing diguanylate cyclase [Sulfuricurvum sp.]|uniref:sensor domain-containing diguanylate cyclase n=1 Tax=Sulfuricurvum sp. TaxID=2025608 RepID=UPI002D55E0AF|nr:sensor domain-containing diguanylate cyclase [Sulfuricurvum sp.]HZF70662.1 sensor domain-containing diguanylate cyclase [Sulfuricurvum sp.]